MNIPIKITFKSVSVEGYLASTGCAKSIAAALPLHGIVNTWGEEIYFEIPVNVQLDETKTGIVEKGDIGYWPPGRAFCIFFGRTPASRGDEIRPASAVNIAGKITGNLEALFSVTDGEPVTIEKSTP